MHADVFPRYQGSLVVVLDNGLELPIPNELLVVPEKIIDSSGEVRTNTTFAEVLIQPQLSDNAGDTPLIGKHFFSSTYLFVDHDAATFTVWQANGTADTRLVSVGGTCSNLQVQESAGDKPDQSTPQASAPPRPTLGTDVEDSSLATRTIVGIAIGAVGVLAVVVGLAVLCLVRKKKRRAHDREGLISSGTAWGDQKNGSDAGSNERSHSETCHIPMMELAATRDVGELDPNGSKSSYSANKPRDASSRVYELAAKTP